MLVPGSDFKYYEEPEITTGDYRVLINGFKGELRLFKFGRVDRKSRNELYRNAGNILNTLFQWYRISKLTDSGYRLATEFEFKFCYIFSFEWRGVIPFSKVTKYKRKVSNY